MVFEYLDEDIQILEAMSRVGVSLHYWDVMKDLCHEVLGGNKEAGQEQILSEEMISRNIYLSFCLFR